MKLQYHTGKNFGDQLNPLIFDHYLPGYFNHENGYVFMGIGSILGFHDKYEGKKIVFSSGYDAGLPSTYGSLPESLESFDFICVRGPKTAKLLGLDQESAVTDGAILLKDIVKKDNIKKYKVSFMPHVGSEEFYDHQLLCEALGWQFISPKWDVEVVLSMIQESECVITEAMHGAIVADTLRVPWMPYQGFKTIGTFKWQDWCESMKLNYEPFILTPYFSLEKTRELVHRKLKGLSLGFLTSLICAILQIRNRYVWSKNLGLLKQQFSTGKFYLSSETVFDEKHQEMLQKLEEFKKRYPVNQFG